MNPFAFVISGLFSGVAGAVAWSALWTVFLHGTWDGHQAFLLPVFALSATVGVIGPLFLRR